ncbi:MAG: EAL domain-containing protein [Desulfobacterales bacterium]|nr:EAL domain-containing protein [Desulfobacterales bacterium]
MLFTTNIMDVERFQGELMTPLEDKNWLSAIECIDFAYQPIVNIHTGICYGHEALLRKYDLAGFKSIDSFFDTAYQDKVLHKVDLILRNIAIKKFSMISNGSSKKMFYNLDNRIITSEDYEQGVTRNILNNYNLARDSLCFEISEKHEVSTPKIMVKILESYRKQGFKIALDDCGAGFSGLQMIYFTEPDYIKIDRFFIKEIANDPKKKLFVSTIVNIGRILGSIVIAEGVETEEEYFICRDIGCDLIQGYFVQRPQIDLGELMHKYENINKLGQEKRKEYLSDDKLLIPRMEYIEPILNSLKIFEAFEKFRNNCRHRFFPVINVNHEPLGVIREESFKNYAYSRFGRELLQNPSVGDNLEKFIAKFPIADILTPIEKIIEIYTLNKEIEGILIVEKMKYVGFLSAHSLLKVINEKNLAIAREQNPLTKLPGNILIHKYVSTALDDKDNIYGLVYLDINNFKAYNDRYGFRNGDRIILLFADILKIMGQNNDRFVAHIGGDDFFIGDKNKNLQDTYLHIVSIIEQFKIDAESFYDSKARQKKYIVSKDREGNVKKFPLVSATAAIIYMSNFNRKSYSIDFISKALASLKKKSKECGRGISICCIGDTKNLEIDPLNNQNYKPLIYYF